VSLVDLDQLNDFELIAQYVVECRGKGHFLPYEDHDTIRQWIGQSQDADNLLLVLSEVLPDYFAKFSHFANPPTLRGVEKLIKSRLKAKKMMR